MTLLYWSLISLCFIISFLALVKPIIPGILFLWGGFFIYHWGITTDHLNWFFWGIQLLFTILLFGVDLLANRFFLSKQGATKWGERIGVLSVIVGSFFFPPFGLVIIPFITVFLTEYSQKKGVKQATKVAFATVISFLASTVSKFIIQLLMIILFILWIWIAS